MFNRLFSNEIIHFNQSVSNNVYKVETKTPYFTKRMGSLALSPCVDYSNPVSWGSDNIIALPLFDKTLYLFDIEKYSLQKLVSVDDRITSIVWLKKGPFLAFGTEYNEVVLWNVKANKKVSLLSDSPKQL